MVSKHTSGAGKVLTGVICALVFFGLAMVYSAGIVDSQKHFGTAYHYISRQILFGALPGLILYFVISRIDYRKLRGWARGFLVLALVATAGVFVPGIGYAVRGSFRWISIGPISFQPSEFLKLGLVLYFAAWFGQRRVASHNTYALIPFLLVLAFAVLLIAKQPDYGTLVVIAAIILALYFFAGAKLSQFVGIVAGMAILLSILFVVSPHSLNRIKTFFNRDNDTQGISYHINQSLIGIGSGGMFGLGFGQSQQKLRFLPEPVGDSIFVIVVEELGFVGAAAVLGLFVILAGTLIIIARAAPDDFGRLFVLGLAVWVIGQSFVNIAAISGMIPLTGLPLPFISFGSSSLVALLAGFGVARNVANHG